MSVRFQACGFVALLAIATAFCIYLAAMLWTILLWRWNVVWVSLGLMLLGARALRCFLIPCRKLQDIDWFDSATGLATQIGSLSAALVYKNILAAAWCVLVPAILFGIAGGGAKIPAQLASIFVSSYTWVREADDDTPANEIAMLITTILSYIIAWLLLWHFDFAQLSVISLAIMVATTLLQLLLCIQVRGREQAR